MKKIISLLVVVSLLLLHSCSGGKKKSDNESKDASSAVAATELVEEQEEEIEEIEEIEEEETNEVGVAKDFPWDFPEGIALEAEPQDNVLSPYSFYPSKIVESDDPGNEVYIFYSTTIKEVGETHSVVGRDVIMPNSLIIAIPKGQQVKKGDIVLTWWQKGSGMQRAIVTDASDPSQPQVCYLDLRYTDKDDNGMANKLADLKPDSFVKIENGEWQPGATIAISQGEAWKQATLINSTDNKVLAMSFGGRIIAVDKDQCQVVPFSLDFKAGDDVYAVWVGSYKDGYTVKKVDKKIGRIWVEDSGGHVEIVPCGEVTKKL